MDHKQSKPLSERNSDEISFDPELRIHALVLRLLNHPRDPRWSAEGVRLLAGELPDDLPIDLPIPEKCNIVGSLLRSRKHFDLVLDTGMPPEKILQFYEENMLAAGWIRPARPQTPPGGFVEAFMDLTQTATFCQTEKGPALTVNVADMGENFTDLRLQLDVEPQSSLCEPLEWSVDLPSSLLPSLVAPADTRSTSQGMGSSGMDQAHTSAALETTLELDELFDHYGQQLDQVGWTQLDAGWNQLTSWSIWRFKDVKDRPWIGLFTVFKPDLESTSSFVQITIHRL